MSHVLIRNGTLIDGNGGSPIRDGAVLIEDNRIAAAGSLTQLPPAPPDATVVDARGGAILPGIHHNVQYS